MAARNVVRLCHSLALGVALLIVAQRSIAADANPLSDFSVLEKITLMADVASPAVIGAVDTGATFPTGVKAAFVGLPKGVILRQGLVKADRGSVYAPLMASGQAVPGSYDATLILTRGKERHEAPVKIIVEPFELYTAIGKSIRLEIPPGQPNQALRGVGYAYSVDVYNSFSRPLTVPPNRSPSSQTVPPFPVGTVQRWVERLGNDPTIPNGPNTRRGLAYAAGNDDYSKVNPFPVGKLGRTSIQSAWVAILPPGQYRLTFEFIPADPAIDFDSLVTKGKATASASMTFEVK